MHHAAVSRALSHLIEKSMYRAIQQASYLPRYRMIEIVMQGAKISVLPSLMAITEKTAHTYCARIIKKENKHIDEGKYTIKK